MNEKRDYIYVAAGLFNLGTNFQNAYITEKLEQDGYTCFLPQRDGFEVARFVEFLETAQENAETMKHASEIAHYVPYYLDLGYFLSRSAAVVASLDDPLDSGMVVEIAYAKLCNIPVIGVRTDIRSPLGNVAESISINPFPVHQCDCYIKASTPSGNIESVYEATDKIIQQVGAKLKELIPGRENKMPQSDNPVLQGILKGSNILFEGLHHPFDKTDMAKIAERYVEHKESFFDKQKPEFLTV